MRALIDGPKHDRAPAQSAMRIGSSRDAVGVRAEAPQALRALNVMQLAGHQFPERTQLLGPLLHAGDLAMWFAARGVGKTQVALSIAMALAFGGKFLRWHVRAPVGVLFLDGEMVGRVMQERVASFLPADAGDELSENFRLFTPDLLPEGQALPDLSTADGQAMVESLIVGNTRVIVIDNLSAWCRTGKENETESWTPMADWLLTLRRRGIAVVLIHHAGKNGEQRGNSKKEDPLDLVVRLRRAGDYDPKTGAAFTWSISKGRHLYGEDAADLDLTLKIADGVAQWNWKLAETSTAERVTELADEGMSVTMIAEELGLNRSTAWRALKKSGKLPTKPETKGVDKPRNAKERAD
ncbi:MAG: AAA family ATPase [Burkholderiales bacterium]